MLPPFLRTLPWDGNHPLYHSCSIYNFGQETCALKEAEKSFSSYGRHSGVVTWRLVFGKPAKVRMKSGNRRGGNMSQNSPTLIHLKEVQDSHVHARYACGIEKRPERIINLASPKSVNAARRGRYRAASDQFFLRPRDFLELGLFAKPRITGFDIDNRTSPEMGNHRSGMVGRRVAYAQDSPRRGSQGRSTEKAAPGDETGAESRVPAST